MNGHNWIVDDGKIIVDRVRIKSISTVCKMLPIAKLIPNIKVTIYSRMFLLPLAVLSVTLFWYLWIKVLRDRDLTTFKKRKEISKPKIG